MSSSEKQKLSANVTARLSKLERDSKTVQSRLTEVAKKECRHIAHTLHKYLSREDIRSSLQTWTEDEAPEIVENDLHVTKVQAYGMIKKRLLDVIQVWENKTRIVHKAAQTMTTSFKNECFFLAHECNDVDDVMKGISLPAGLSLKSGGQSQMKLEASDIAIIAVTAPIWIPLGILALVTIVPVGIGIGVVKKKLAKEEYTDDKAKYMREWTLILLDHLQRVDNVSSLIEQMYLKSMLDRIECICSDYIPKQIATDRVLLDSIVRDKRTAHEIIFQFRIHKEKLQKLFQTMYLFDLRYLANDVIGISKIRRYEHIGSGSFSDVYRATWRHGNGKMQEVALKILKGHNMYLQLSEVDCSRRLKNQNIVKFYGVVFADRERNRGGSGGPRSQDAGLPLYDDRLMLVLDMCEQTLESLVFGTTQLQCGSFSDNLSRGEAHTFYFKMAVSICEGLAYMHSVKFLHRDLKLSNVLVKDGIGKLCDLGFARAEVAITGTVAGTLTHMAPELLNDKLYSFSSDVYSLGILLWGLWYGKRSYSDTRFGHLGVRQFIDDVTGGARPNCELKHTLFPDLKKLVEKCWDNNPNYRPTVEEVATELKKIDGENRRVISR